MKNQPLINKIKIFYSNNILKIVLFGLFFVPAWTQAQTKNLDWIEIHFNKEVILHSEVQEAIKAFKKSPLYKKKDYKNEAELRNAVIQRLIDQKILQAEIEKNNIVVSEAEVNEAIENLKKQRQMSQATFLAEIKKRGLALNAFKEEFERNLTERKFAEQVIQPSVKISDQEIRDYYQKNLNQFQVFQKVRFRQLTLTPQSRPNPNQSFEAFILDLYPKILKQKSLLNFVKKYSRGGFADNNGDSGWLEIKRLKPELANFLQRMKKGEISKPIPISPTEVLILRLLDKKDPKPADLNSVKNQIRQVLFGKKGQQQLENYIKAARSNHYIKITQP